MSLPVAILAGGLATRLRPITEKTPKSLVEVAGKPFALHQIELLRKNDLTEIVFCVGFLGEKIQAALKDGRQWGVHIRYVFDWPDLRGTGGALRQALPFLGGAFFVLYGDSYLECDYGAVEHAFYKSGKLGLMTVLYNLDQWDKSNVVYTKDEILKYDKRNPTQDMHYIDYGLGILTRQALSIFPDNARFDLAEIYQDLISRKQLAGYEVNRRFYEIGSLAGLRETREHLSNEGMG
jgi:NDP-sugar pyrophosphorylase family protein